MQVVYITLVWDLDICIVTHVYPTPYGSRRLTT